jgi:hypothetical protein
VSDFDSSLDPNRMEGNLTEREVAVRDYFVGEYVKDFDPFRACIRMGFLSAFAVDQAKMFITDGYVLRKVDFLTRKPIEPSAEDKAEMLANLRWLALNGSAPSRTTATQRYMEAQGYVAKDSNGAEAQAAALVDALQNFAINAPS